MKKGWIALVSFVVLPAFVAIVAAHPHFNKTVTAKLPGGAEVTITYNTTPANESHAENAAVGSFVTPRRPRIKTSADLVIGNLTIAAGEYVIGAIKESKDNWTMALYPGQLGREAPDMSKVIKLESMYSSAQGNAEHMLIDVTPGHGKFEGRAVLTLHFGTMFLAGALS